MCTQHGRREKRAAGARFKMFSGSTNEVEKQVDDLLASGARVLNLQIEPSGNGVESVIGVMYVNGYFGKRREAEDQADSADPYAGLNTAQGAE